MQDTKPLLVFAAVLEHGSMNAAATALGMTPSAVSQHVSRLEALHGVKLLHRSTRRLSPTDAGRSLGIHCARLLHTLADAHQALENLKTEAAGEVHIALASVLADAPPFQAALQRLRQEYPNILPVLHAEDALADLQREPIDIALRGGLTALEAPDLIARPLASWRWQICAAPDYLARHGTPQQPEDLHRHRWIYCLPLRFEMTRGNGRYLFDGAGHTACRQLSTVRSLTLGGLGLSLQLEGEVRELTARGLLQPLLADWVLPAVDIYAVTSVRVQSAKTEAVLRILQECFAADAQNFQAA